MPERARKRVFRRRLHTVDIWGDSQAVMKKMIEGANDYYLFLMNELEAEAQQQAGQFPTDVFAEVPRARPGATDDDVNTSLHRLEAVASLWNSAGPTRNRQFWTRNGRSETRR